MYHLCYRKRNCIVYSTVREIRYSEVCKMYLEILLLWQTKTAYVGGSLEPAVSLSLTDCGDSALWAAEGVRSFH